MVSAGPSLLHMERVQGQLPVKDPKRSFRLFHESGCKRELCGAFFAIQRISELITRTNLGTIDRLLVAAPPGREIDCSMLKRVNPGHPFTLIT